MGMKRAYEDSWSEGSDEQNLEILWNDMERVDSRPEFQQPSSAPGDLYLKMLEAEENDKASVKLAHKIADEEFLSALSVKEKEDDLEASLKLAQKLAEEGKRDMKDALAATEAGKVSMWHPQSVIGFADWKKCTLAFSWVKH